MPFWNRIRGGGAGRASQAYRSDSVMLPRWTNPPERNTQEWIEAYRTNPRLSVVERIASDLSFAEGKLYRVDENGNEIIKTMDARGRDIISGLPKTMEVNNKDMMIALQESMDIIVDGVKATIEKAPPEIAADIAEHGMVLSGGGGMIANLDKLISKRTGMAVTVADNAFEAVAVGTGMSLENIEKLKIYASNGRKKYEAQ